MKSGLSRASSWKETCELPPRLRAGRVDEDGGIDAVAFRVPRRAVGDVGAEGAGLAETRLLARVLRRVVAAGTETSGSV